MGSANDSLYVFRAKPDFELKGRSPCNSGCRYQLGTLLSGMAKLCLLTTGGLICVSNGSEERQGTPLARASLT